MSQWLGLKITHPFSLKIDVDQKNVLASSPDTIFQRDEVRQIAVKPSCRRGPPHGFRDPRSAVATGRIQSGGQPRRRHAAHEADASRSETHYASTRQCSAGGAAGLVLCPDGVRAPNKVAINERNRAGHGRRLRSRVTCSSASCLSSGRAVRFVRLSVSGDSNAKAFINPSLVSRGNLPDTRT